jgi:hypothetical protein
MFFFFPSLEYKFYSTFKFSLLYYNIQDSKHIRYKELVILFITPYISAAQNLRNIILIYWKHQYYKCSIQLCIQIFVLCSCKLSYSCLKQSISYRLKAKYIFSCGNCVLCLTKIPFLKKLNIFPLPIITRNFRSSNCEVLVSCLEHKFKWPLCLYY